METNAENTKKVWRVLIVDDEAEIPRFMRRALYLSLNDKVFIELATGGAEGLGKVDDRLDILITDCQMPDVSGPELIARARAINPGLKVILMSGYSGADERLAQAAKDPFVKTLQKPFDPKDLVALLTTLMT